jgi:hypothetical protein
MMNRETKLAELNQRRELSKMQVLSGESFVKYLAENLEAFSQKVDQLKEQLSGGIDIRALDVAEQLSNLEVVATAVDGLKASLDSLEVPDSVKLDAKELIKQLQSFKIEPVVVKINDTNPVSNYRHSDSDEKTNVKFYGYLAPSGAFYILEHSELKDGNKSRYHFGSSGYGRAWNMRNQLTYKLLDEAINEQK